MAWTRGISFQAVNGQLLYKARKLARYRIGVTNTIGLSFGMGLGQDAREVPVSRLTWASGSRTASPSGMESVSG